MPISFQEKNMTCYFQAPQEIKELKHFKIKVKKTPQKRN